ncbi:MAG: hypothetical protein OXG53_04745 [Chloroflexi bacterium]|nr:hypothetical protein [Chloroflexota bacterium]
MDWLQVGAFTVAVLGLGLAGVVYITRQLNRQFDRIDDRFDKIDVRFDRLEERMVSAEQWQARADERFDRIDTQLERHDKGLQDVNGGLQNVEIEQARMLGFLEGRGVMGKAPPEPERAT